jgi:hypothetical protein
MTPAQFLTHVRSRATSADHLTTHTFTGLVGSMGDLLASCLQDDPADVVVCAGRFLQQYALFTDSIGRDFAALCAVPAPLVTPSSPLQAGLINLPILVGCLANAMTHNPNRQVRVNLSAILFAVHDILTAYEFTLSDAMRAGMEGRDDCR